MKAPRLKQKADGHWALSGHLSFDSIPALYREGLSMLANKNELIVDLTEVSHSDSSGVALLTTWFRAAKKANCEIHFNNAPSFMRSFAKVSGIDHLLPWS